MNEHHCDTCVHWHNPWDQAGAKYLHGLAEKKLKDVDRSEWGICGLIAMPGYGEAPEASAFVQDGSDYAADFHTRSDFGCVLWQAPEDGA